MPARTRHAATADHEALLDALKALTAGRDEERRLRLAAESRLSASSAASTRTLAKRDEERRLRLAAENRLSASARTLAERDEERRLRLAAETRHSACARTLAALQAEAATTSSMLSSGLDRISAKGPTSAPSAPLPTSTEYSYGLPALAYQLLSKLEALASESLSDRDEELHALKDQLAALQAKLDAQRPSEALPLLAEQIGSASRLHHDNALPTLLELAEELHAIAHDVAVLEKQLQEAEQKLRDGEYLRKKQLHMNASVDRPPWRF